MTDIPLPGSRPDPVSDEAFRNDELVRMAAVVMDPTYARPAPPPRKSAADLIEVAHRQRRAWVARTVSLAVVPALLLVAAAVGLAAGRAPEPAATPSQVALVPPSPLAVTRVAKPKPARTELLALATRVGALSDLRVAGAYTFVHTREWARDPTGRSTPAHRDHRLWWAADRSGRRMTADVSSADPASTDPPRPVATPQVVEYAPGGLAVPIPDPAPAAPLLASQLVEQRRSLGEGAHGSLRAIMDLYRYHALDPPRRAAVLQVLGDTEGVNYLGGVVDRAGRAGVAVSADSDSGAVRDIAVFDPVNGRLLSYERLEGSGGGATVVESVAILSAGRTHHAG